MKRARSTGLSSMILHSLAELQDGLNGVIDKNWRNVRRLDDWSLAITMEGVELIDSYPWKWWKNINAQPDIKNVKIELVDILHFSLSGEMQLRSAEVAPAIARRPPSELIHPCCPPAMASSAEIHSKTISGIADVMFFPLSDTQNAVASIRNIVQLANVYRFDWITEAVIAAAEDLGFNLVAYYVAKHTLNTIRQMDGYKNGTYVKVRDGVEDNELLHDCIAPFSFDQVLSEETYRGAWGEIMGNVFEAFGTPKEARLDINHWLKPPTAEESAATGVSS